MLEKWIRGLARARWFVIAAWLIMAIVSVLTLPDLQQIVKEKETKFVPDHAESIRAQQLAERINPDDPSQSSAVIVIQRKQGLTDGDKTWLKETAARILREKEKLGVLNVTSAFDSPAFSEKFVSTDRTTELVLLGLPKDANHVGTQETVDKLGKVIQGSPKGASVHLTGSAPISKEFTESSQEGLNRTEILTVVLVLSILLIVFRSPIAPFVPLLTIGMSLIITRGLVALAAEHGLPVSSFTEAFLIAVLFGAGTDYCILLIHRFREELGHEGSKTDALVRTLKTVGKTVLFSGSTVLIAFFLIGFAVFGLYQSAVGVAIGMGVTLLAGLTFTPALMLLLGKKMFWPMRVKSGAAHGDSKLWAWLGRVVEKRTVAILLVTVIVLAPLITFFEGKRSFNDIAEMNPNNGSVIGFKQVEDKFSSGEVLPVSVTITSSESMRTPEALAALEKATAAASQLPNVAEVRSATRPLGDPISELTVPRQMKMANDGLGKLQNGVKQVAVGLEQSESGLGTGRQNASKLQQGLTRMSQQTLQAKAGLEQVSGGLDQTDQGIAQMKQAAGASAAAAGSMQGDFDVLAKKYPDLAKDPAFLAVRRKQQGLTGGLGQLQAGFDSLSAGVTRMTSAVGKTSDGLGQLAAGQKQAADGVGQLTQGLASLQDGLDKGSSALGEVASGMDQISQIQQGIADNGSKQIAGWYLPEDVLSTSDDLKLSLDNYVSPDGKTTKLDIVLSINPYSKEAMDTIADIRSTVKQSLLHSAVKDPQVLLGGTTAQYDELKDISQSDFLRTGGLVLLGIYIILVLLLRSWIAPFYLLLSLVFNYLITMGLLELIFVKGLGYEGLSWTVAFFVFLIIVALGVDYSIFLMARFKEEYRPGGIAAAMKKAMATTGSVIMSAAVIMGGTFAALMYSGVDTLVQIGAGIVIGLAVYTTVMMGLVVPGMALLFGEANWAGFHKRKAQPSNAVSQPLAEG